MNLRKQNELIFAGKLSVRDPEHCGCEDCTFYANNIIKHKQFIQFLESLGIDATKADEVWCYNEEHGNKYFSVDFWCVYSELEGTFQFDNVEMTILRLHHAEDSQPTHAISIEAALKI